MTDNLQVWHAGSFRGEAERLHTRPDCRALEQANTVVGPKPRSVLQSDLEICNYCAGKWSPTSRGQSDILKTISDPDFGPEDLGLSPLDEDRQRATAGGGD